MKPALRTSTELPAGGGPSSDDSANANANASANTAPTKNEHENGGDSDVADSESLETRAYAHVLEQLEVLRNCRLDQEDEWRAAADKVVSEFLVPLQERWRELERARRSLVGQKRAVTKRAKTLAARSRRGGGVSNGHPRSSTPPMGRKSSSSP